MLKAYPAYEKELENFIELTPIRARRLFSWLCKKRESETGQECGDRLVRLTK